MPWCPKCRQEYVETARQCADCEVALVADLHAPARSQTAAPLDRGPELPPCAIRGAPALLERVAEWLKSEGIEFEGSPASGELAIAGRVADVVAGSLGRGLDVEYDEGVILLHGPKSAPPPLDPAVARRPYAEIAGNLPEHLRPLLEVAARAPGRDGARATERLVQLHRDQRVDLAALLVDAVRTRDRLHVVGLVRALQELQVVLPGLARQVGELLPRLAADRLAPAFHVIAHFPDVAVAPALLPYLSHPQSELRGEADDVLISLSGQDMQFEADAPDNVRAQAIQRWRAWIDENARRT